MKVLVCGAGVIGSLLIHNLAVAGSDVTVLARGKRYAELSENGLRIKPSKSKEILCDEVKVVEAVPCDEHFDVAFSVMQYEQQLKMLDTLAAIDCDTLALVGNNPKAKEVSEDILAKSAKSKTILFGFQGTGGERKDGYVETFSVGKAGMTLGGVDGEADDASKKLVTSAFEGSDYELKWMDNMDAWLKCHLAFVIPIAYACYACDCDLRKSTKEQRKLILDATNEGFNALKAAGYDVRPVGEDVYYACGAKRALMAAMLYVMAKTKLGDLAAANHCKHAVSEMHALSEEYEKEIFKTTIDLSAYKKLKFHSPSWEALGNTNF